LADNLDVSLAWTCVAEGDAVITQRAYSARYSFLYGGASVVLASARGAAADVPPSIARELFFPYQEGADWLAAVRQRGGNDAVNRLLAEPPAAGTAAILHPDLFDSGFVPATVTLPDLSKALGDGWSRESGGAFGEFQMRNYLQLRLPASDAVRGSTGWGGDRYDVYVRGSESVAVFRVRFRSADEAQQFREAQTRFLATNTSGEIVESGATVTTTRDGKATARLGGGRPDEVIFVIGSSPKVAERAARALSQG
jgi:hypothetical protein